ncbi:hypothetical protein RFI_25644, partial [Reticulomyxa filosa]
MEKFADYKKLTDNFMIVLCSYVEKPPMELDTLYEKKLLSGSSKEFQLMVDREKSELFHIMWKRQTTHNSDPISIIVSIFKQADSDWGNLISKIRNNTLQYIDLEPYKITNWKLEMNILFSDTKHQEKNTAQDYSQNIENALIFLETEEHWKLLKKATDIIQNIHQIKTTVDDKDWHNFKKKIQTSIKKASGWYLKCKDYFGDISDKKDMLELICNNKEKIQALANDEIFTNRQQFEILTKRMDDSQNEKFRQLAGTLPEVNEKMKEKIWDINFRSSYELAKAILTLSEQKSKFGNKLANCLNMDFEGLFGLVEEGDQLSVVKGLGQFERAGQTGKW